MSEKREAPLSRMWTKAKVGGARQKVIASSIRNARRAKPGSTDEARTILRAEAAKQGVTDLSDRELATMTEAVHISPKEAATQAVSKGTAGVKSLWASLQSSGPAWAELPDDVAALNLRSDQTIVAVPIEIEAPDVVARIMAELPPEKDGARTLDVWIAREPGTRVAAVCVGALRLGRVPAERSTSIDAALDQRRFWVGAAVRDGVVTIGLPDRP